MKGSNQGNVKLFNFPLQLWKYAGVIPSKPWCTYWANAWYGYWPNVKK